MSTAFEAAATAIEALRPTTDVSLLSTRIFKCDLDALREFLILAACPVVCRGYLDGDENWHELCITKGKAALAALEVGDA